MRKLLLSLALSLVAVTTSAAQSIAGEWDASMNTPGGAREFKIVFVQNGEVLTGTVKRPTGDVPLQGTIKGTEVKFSYSIQYGGNPVSMAMTATLTGNSMKGHVDIASQVKEEFSATRSGTTPP